RLTVDGEERVLRDQLTYKGVLVEDVPNLAWIIGYTNASWTLKADISGTYLCRLLQHMDDNGYTAAVPRDLDGCALDTCMFDMLSSGYVKRGQNELPRQGSKHPWRVLMHYEKDSEVLLEDPVDDGVMQFSRVSVGEAVA
ncbi:MAG: FAD-containing monooxygenase EthA, partial [Mycobacterium sp.]|nr:FAD-containing monooxygenase EthA [Mycobacterium sp.]